MHRRTPPKILLIAGAAIVALIAVASLLLGGGQTSSGGQTAASGDQPAASMEANSVVSADGSAPKQMAAKRRPKIPKPGPGQHLIVLVNKTNHIIWAAGADDPKHRLSATGWRLAPGETAYAIAAHGWRNRIWGRTGCSFDSRGRGHCQTGDCGGRFQCGHSWGSLPATLFEANLDSGWNNLDWVDISNVDGNNDGMTFNHWGGATTPDNKDKISPTGCGPGGCVRDILSVCPPVLQQRAGGKVVACRSSCLAFGTDQYCCRGRWASPCRPDQWPVKSAALFKSRMPDAYSWSGDDQTSMFVCHYTARSSCNYKITWGVSPFR